MCSYFVVNIFNINKFYLLILMNWKQFLKPDLSKVLLTIFIGVSIFGLSFLMKILPIAIFETIGIFLYAVFLLFLFTFFLCPLSIGPPPTTSQSILCFISLILIFIYWYLISCLILWLWNKRSSKRKRK